MTSALGTDSFRRSSGTLALKGLAVSIALCSRTESYFRKAIAAHAQFRESGAMNRKLSFMFFINYEIRIPSRSRSQAGHWSLLRNIEDQNNTALLFLRSAGCNLWPTTEGRTVEEISAGENNLRVFTRSSHPKASWIPRPHEGFRCRRILRLVRHFTRTLCGFRLFMQSDLREISFSSSRPSSVLAQIALQEQFSIKNETLGLLQPRYGMDPWLSRLAGSRTFPIFPPSLCITTPNR